MKGTTLSESNAAASNTIIPSVVSGYDTRSTAIVQKTREQSRMSQEVRAVHFALEEYFAWQTGGMKVLGMSSRSIIARLMEEGPTGAAQKGSIIPQEMPQKFLDVRDAINNLPDIRKKAITYTYNSSVPVEVVAARLNTSVSRTRNLVSEARQRIAAFLSGRGWRLNPD